MTIGEIKRVIEDANLQDEAETNVLDILVTRTEYEKMKFDTREQSRCDHETYGD